MADAAHRYLVCGLPDCGRRFMAQRESVVPVCPECREIIEHQRRAEAKKRSKALARARKRAQAGGLA